MSNGEERTRLTPRVRSCLNALATILALVLTRLPSFSQYDHRVSDYKDPEQLDMTAKRQKLEQDEMNIIVQQIDLAEREMEALKISRQLEALTLMPSDEISPRLQEYQSEMCRKHKDIERQIEATKKDLETRKEFLEEGYRQLNERENEYKRRMAFESGRPDRSPSGEYLSRINQQNESLRQQSVQRQKDSAMQNLRLIEREKNLLRQGPLGIPPVPIADRYDAAEYKLCEMLEEKVSERDYDIAEINLLAAKGLPGAEHLDVDKTLKTFDLWAAWVKHETDRHLYRFQKAPDEYGNSEAYFRILMMVCTLQEDFRICYNKDPKMRAGPVEIVPNDFSFFGNSRDLFVHGLTEAEHEGTCASLPVFYVAIGRRLGYPLKLVECKGHLFVRWEDGKERFNIEGTNRGLNCYPDEEYMEWPWPISQEELATGMYMKSLSPRRELAAFLELRSLCLKQLGQEQQHRTVKLYADGLRKKEGVDLDRLVQLMKDSVRKSSGDGTVESTVMYQTLTNTNSWRGSDDRRGSHEKHSVFYLERFDSK